MHNKRETMSHHGNLANYPELRKSWVLEETPQTLICSTSIIPSNNLKAFVLIPIYLIPSSRKLPFVTNRDYYKKSTTKQMRSCGAYSKWRHLQHIPASKVQGALQKRRQKDYKARGSGSWFETLSLSNIRGYTIFIHMTA